MKNGEKVNMHDILGLDEYIKDFEEQVITDYKSFAISALENLLEGIDLDMGINMVINDEQTKSKRNLYFHFETSKDDGKTNVRYSGFN